MTPYPEYKETGLAWLPQVPKHWEHCRYKDILRPKDIRVGTDLSYTLLSLTKQGVIIRDLSVGKGKFPKDFETYKVVSPNDLILCLFDVDETPQTVGISHNHGMITGAYDIFQVRNINIEFLHYSFLAIDNAKSFKPLYRGLRKTIPLPRLLGESIFFPSADEQAQIVRYLDSMTAKINKLIRAKKRQIALLQEQKQAIINQAVTKGLDPNAEMKDSGIDWLGSIPKHWQVKRCKYLFKEKNLRSEHGKETHLSMSQQHGLIPDRELEKHRMLSESYEGGKLCEINDLVLNRLKAHLGVFALSPQMGVVSPDYTVLSIKQNEFLPVYAENILKSYNCRPELRKRVRGVVEGFWRLYTENFYDISLPVPPLDTQKAIMSFINDVQKKVKKFVSDIKKMISFAEEYKQTLIASVVMGQIDVRNIEIPDFNTADLNIAEDSVTDPNELDSTSPEESEE